ncbi:MAG: metallophosphoesterase family protein [Bacteroidales bacterium]|nr:metallophosphoesterase family protein [Bacteroidales bacterium]
MRNKIKILLFLLLLAGESMTAKELTFNKQGTFKIVQFTDVHYVPNDPRSDTAMIVIREVLDAEKPDIVIFTGDIVTGKPAHQGWNTVAGEVIKRNIPFAVALGNHDDETDMTRDQLAQMIVRFPGNLNAEKQKGVKGFLHTVIPVRHAKGGNAALLYIMDSNNYSTIDSLKGYGWFTADQIAWYERQSRKYNKKNDTLPALAFFHIPLPEYRTAYDKLKTDLPGSRREEECAPELNTGMFYAMHRRGDVMATFTGHDHDNDYVAPYLGIWLCYGRFTGGKTTYTNLKNGARIIELHEGQRTFTTWVRLFGGEVADRIDYPL